MATQLGEALEIYNFTDTTQTVRYGPNGEPQFAISQSEEFQRVSWDSVMFISQTISFIPYFMAVVSKISGRHTNEGKISRMAGDTSMYSTSKETPVRKYVLDHAIYGIDVDEDTGTILATDVNSNDPILSFKI